jgi:triosephosphate isomerase
MDKKLYFFANWKMYLGAKDSTNLAKEYLNIEYPENCKVAVFPSAFAVPEIAKILKGSELELGAQNTYWADKGGYTGEISAVTYKEMGCTYALVGHAERRHIFHESNHDVRLKIEALLQLGITPVLCVGETGEERKKNQIEEVLEAQIRSAFMDLSWPEDITPIVAYEPVWAIGTGESCDAKEAERISDLISSWSEELIGQEPVILYGGSVRGENISGYLAEEHISGALVGGASAKAESWSELIGCLE